jgi:hypothetical protein
MVRRVTDDENEDGMVHYEHEEANGMQMKKGKHVQDAERLFICYKSELGIKKDFGIVYSIVPKHGGKDQKRVLVSSAKP